MSTIHFSHKELLELSDAVGAMSDRVLARNNQDEHLTADIAALNLRWGIFQSEYELRTLPENVTGPND